MFAVTNVETLLKKGSSLKPPSVEKYPYADLLVAKISILSPVFKLYVLLHAPSIISLFKLIILK